MTHPAQKLRDLLKCGDHFIAADAYSALTARIVERVGFKAAYLGGHACGVFHYAIPDNGVFPQMEQIDQAARIADAIDIPLIADADTLGETVAEAYYLTRRYVRAGVAGIHVEDEINPKHSSYAGGLISTEDMQARLEASVRGRGDSPFVIIARCDELYPSARGGGGTGSLEDAIKRGKAYAESGADALCFPLASKEHTAVLVKELNVPICVLGEPIEGTAMTLHTGWGYIGAAQLHWERARKLFETGSPGVTDYMIPEKNALIDQDFYDELIADWARKTGRPLR